MRKFQLLPLKWYLIIFGIAAAIIALDQLTKFWIRLHLDVGQSWPDAGFFRLTYAQNTGGAFSIFYGAVEILTIVSILGVIALLAYVFYAYQRFPFLNIGVNKVALGMVLGGTIGNLVDRAAHHYVIDFIDVGPWPIFNVADMSMVCGIFVFAFSVLLISREIDQEHHL